MAILNLKLDVSKIDKNRLYKGEKGTYLDVTVFLNAEADQYGHFGMVVQDVKKEEREAGIKGAILGNVRRATGLDELSGGTPKADEVVRDMVDDLPF